MHQPIRQSTHEARAILADVYNSPTHPSTKEKPEPGSPASLHLMHYLHSVLLASGRLANRNIERKKPNWPLKSDEVSVLGYGAEKVVYRVKDSSPRGDNVVSVYHLESMRKNPKEVIDHKKARYETYKKYFGDLVLPTTFVIIDNPWGDGAKPASIQPFIEDAQKFSDLSPAELKTRAENDKTFGNNLDMLVSGYQQMLQDDLSPDFASSNLLVSGSDIVIFDTGWLYTSKKAYQLAQRHPNYQTIEQLS